MSIDSLYTHVLYRIHNNHLSGFPTREENAFEKKRGKQLPYPGTTYYSINKRQHSPGISLKITQKIDSLVEDYFLSETSISADDRSDADDTFGKGRSKDELKKLMSLLEAYFDYPITVASDLIRHLAGRSIVSFQFHRRDVAEL